MLGTINRKVAMTGVIERFPGITEIYSTPDFDFDKDGCTLTFLLKIPVDQAQLYYALRNLFSLGVHIYFVFDQYSNLLKDKRIIWRDNRWFI